MRCPSVVCHGRSGPIAISLQNGPDASLDSEESRGAKAWVDADGYLIPECETEEINQRHNEYHVYNTIE